jgi:translation initiation factor IF-2
MSKLRVYELARELNIDSKLMVSRLKQIGVVVATHQSTLTDDQLVKARAALGGGSATAASAAATPSRSAVSAAPAPAAAAAASGRTVVIRRRRPGTEEENPAPAATEEKSATESETSAEVSRSEAAPVIDAPKVEVATAAAPVVASEKPAAQEPAAVAQQAAPQPAQPTTRVMTPTSRDATFSATIVRKVSPEELARQKTEAANLSTGPQGGQQFRSRQRREDSRGTRIGAQQPQGGGSSGPQGGGQNPERVTAIHSQAHEEALRTWRRNPDARVRENPKEVEVVGEETEESLRLKAKKKAQDRFVSARQLLDRYTLEGDVDEFEEVNRKKTVFTPDLVNKKRDLKRRKDLKKTQITTPRAEYRVVEMKDGITVAELARQLSVKGTEVLKKLMDSGMMITINANVDYDTAVLIAGEYNYEVKNVAVQIEDILKTTATGNEGKKAYRSPIVTVMGHVDHGKTSILDAIRKTNVTKGEAGGITQHIGAYSVEHEGKRIAFLDTPGHAAFSSMRARGADLTDIVVLVVAADDGVMPQTVEAISHARAANVPIVVAINKIDKHGQILERLYSQLAEHGIQSEEWGGDNQFVKVSALKGVGISELLEAILLQAEVLELTAVSTGPAAGVVVEAHVDKGRGPVATLMVKEGKLEKGQYIVAGTTFGRVRAMLDHNGKTLDFAGPSTPIEVLGLNEVPKAGDQIHVVADEKTARTAVDWRLEQARNATVAKSSAQSLEDLLNRVNVEDQIEVPIIVKGDTQGSVEAIVEAIGKITSPKIRNKIIHSAVGGVTESDVALAQTASAVVIGFNVRGNSKLMEYAENQGVIVKFFSIIYEIVDTVKGIMTGRLPTIKSQVVVGHAQVRNPIKIPKIGVIAGSSVTDGKITRQSRLRVIRDDVVIFEGKVGSLRRFKDDVSEVLQGYECGIALDGYNDLREGDVIEAFVIEESQATL